MIQYLEILFQYIAEAAIFLVEDWELALEVGLFVLEDTDLLYDIDRRKIHIDCNSVVAAAVVKKKLYHNLKKNNSLHYMVVTVEVTLNNYMEEMFDYTGATLQQASVANDVSDKHL